jgi:serine protease
MFLCGGFRLERRTLRLLPALLAASILAACSSNGGSTLPSAATPQSNPGFITLGTYTATGDAAQLIHFMPSNDVLSSPRGPITTMRRPGGGGNLVYHNGPIQPASKTYVVYWGAAWTGSGDPKGVQTYLNNFLGHVGGTSWNATVTQYTQSDGTHTGNPANNFGGSYVDSSSNPPSSPTQSQMAAEAVKAAAHFGDYSVSAQYIVAMPTGVSPSGFKTQYCAYHSSTSANGSTISWTNLPYLPDAGSGCGAGSVTGSALDGVSIVEGHEYAEAETDPQPNSGWLDGSGAEIGDKCAWVALADTNLNGTSFPTQPLWSNAANAGAGGCVQTYP